MVETIEQILFEQDGQIPKRTFFKAIHQAFGLEQTDSGIIELDGYNLVILQKDKKCYLFFRNAPKEILEQLHALLKQVTISMYMRVPLNGAESIWEEEKYWPPDFAERIRKSGLKQIKANQPKEDKE